MSLRQTLRTVRDLFRDPELGLSASIDALKSDAENPANVESDVAFVTWKRAGTMQQTAKPSVWIRPGRWSTDVKQALGSAELREGTAVIDIGYETFAADADALEDNLAVASVAVARTLDSLRDYSDAHDGPVIDIEPPIEYQFGQFQGPVSSGFIASVSILERGTD